MNLMHYILPALWWLFLCLLKYRLPWASHFLNGLGCHCHLPLSSSTQFQYYLPNIFSGLCSTTSHSLLPSLQHVNCIFWKKCTCIRLKRISAAELWRMVVPSMKIWCVGFMICWGEVVNLFPAVAACCTSGAFYEAAAFGKRIRSPQWSHQVTLIARTPLSLPITVRTLFQRGWPNFHHKSPNGTL